MLSAPSSSLRAIPLSERDELAAAREVNGDEAAARGDYAEALSCWGEALGILEERASSAAVARVASKMAAAEEALGRMEEAIGHYSQAADAYMLSGETHFVPMCLNNLAMLHKLSGRTRQAAEMLRRALGLCVHCFGENHQESALIASNLGAVLTENRDLSGAIQAHMQALGVREHLYGPTHPEVGLSLGHLAAVYQLSGEEEKARRHYEAALAILDEFPGVHDAENRVLRANLAELNSDEEEG